MPDGAILADTPVPRKIGRPEHNLQVQVKKFVRDCVDSAVSVFMAFDRSRNHSGMQHLMEAQRGVQRGTPDTLLLVPGVPDVFCEIKAGKNKPSDDQERLGRAIIATGRHWFWANSVTSYMRGLQGFGVPLRPNAALVAEHLDLLLAGREAKRKSAAPKTSVSKKPRAPKPTLGRIRRVNAARAKVMF